MSMYKAWGRKGYIRECVNKLKEYVRTRGKKNEKTIASQGNLCRASYKLCQM